MSFFSSIVGEGKIYWIFYNASGVSGFIIWLGIAICHYRFRRAWVAQGNKVEDLKYRSKFYPFGPIFAMITITIVIFGSNIWVFSSTDTFWFDFVTSYILIPLTPLLYLVYKYTKKTKIVPLMECDFTMPKETVDDEGERVDLVK